MTQTQMFRNPLLTSVFVLGALSACAEPEQNLSSAEQPFATGLSGEAVHEEATADGLPFLRTEIVTALQAANVATDIVFFFESAYHFDDCNFSGASQAVAQEQAQAVAQLGPATDTPEADLSALTSFGHSLHSVQDFYAHSNWVELGETGLVDASLSAWPTIAPYSSLEPSGIAVVQGAPPRGTAIWRNRGARYPRNAVVFVQTGSERTFGLMSGTVDLEPGNFCPPQIAMTHNQLNKDRSTDPDRTAEHATAKALATEQTTHEWCRLLSMTRAAWGDAGDQRLFDWVDDEPAASLCGDPADLSVDIESVSPNPATLGSVLELEVAYGNAGPATAFGTRVLIDLPDGLAAQTVTADAADCTITNGDVDCYVGELTPTGSGSVFVDMTALVAGEQPIEAAVTAHVEDTNVANDSSIESVLVNEAPTASIQ